MASRWCLLHGVGLTRFSSKAVAHTVWSMNVVLKPGVAGATVAVRAACSCWKVSKWTKGLDRRGRGMRPPFCKGVDFIATKHSQLCPCVSSAGVPHTRFVAPSSFHSLEAGLQISNFENVSGASKTPGAKPNKE